MHLTTCTIILHSSLFSTILSFRVSSSYFGKSQPQCSYKIVLIKKKECIRDFHTAYFSRMTIHVGLQMNVTWRLSTNRIWLFVHLSHKNEVILLFRVIMLVWKSLIGETILVMTKSIKIFNFRGIWGRITIFGHLGPKTRFWAYLGLNLSPDSGWGLVGSVLVKLF